MRLHVRTWKPAVVRLSPLLEQYVRQMAQNRKRYWLSVQDVLESMQRHEPLYLEADALFREHGEFFFKVFERLPACAGCGAEAERDGPDGLRCPECGRRWRPAERRA